MLAFLQPSLMVNDQIYMLSVRPFHQRLTYVINTIEKTGKVSEDVLASLKEGLNNQAFMDTIYSPSLNYFVIDLTTFVSNGVNYKVDESGLIRKLLSSNKIEKFISYFILPCAKHGIEIKNILVYSNNGEIEIPGLNYIINTPENIIDYHVSTLKNKITIFNGTESVSKIQLDKTEATIIDKCSTFTIKKLGINTIDGISLTYSDAHISQYFTNNFRELNIRNSNVEGLIKNIDITVNDHLYYKSCLDLIAEIWPDYYMEISSHIKLLAIMDTDAFGGFTTNLLPDAIFLSHHPNDFLWVTENIVHECAHSRLEQLLVIDPIVLNEPTERFKSPWREDPRPMKGVYHGVFAFARVAIWLERLYEVYPLSSISQRLEVVRQQLEQGIALISQSGKLSPIGEHIFSEIRDSVEKNKQLVKS